MAMVVKVRFKRASRLYDFDTNGIALLTGSRVVTETVRGLEIGECMTDPQPIEDDSISQALKPVLREASEEDLRVQRENENREREAMAVAVRQVGEIGLEMKMVDVEYAFDRSKITFYFTADGRVDFRPLVRSLATVLKTRIELRQIGVRDEAKMLGGIGPCGRPICCRAFLSDFTPVSIKMAKEQNLSLNPTKISGLCDRLMCCLKYEQDNYEQVHKRMPRIGKEVETPDGVGVVNSLNVLGETVRVRIAVGDSYEMREYPADVCRRTDRSAQVPTARRELSLEEAAGRLREAEREKAPERPKENTGTEEKEEPAPEEEETTSGTEQAPRRSRRGNRRRGGSGKGKGQGPGPDRPEAPAENAPARRREQGQETADKPAKEPKRTEKKPFETEEGAEREAARRRKPRHRHHKGAKPKAEAPKEE